MNVGVVLYCEDARFLAAQCSVHPERLAALDPSLDLDRVRAGLAFVESVCRGAADAGAVADKPLGTRFGFLKAPRSTVVRPGPVHGGVTSDPERTLDHLVHQLVG